MSKLDKVLADLEANKFATIVAKSEPYGSKKLELVSTVGLSQGETVIAVPHTIPNPRLVGKIKGDSIIGIKLPQTIETGTTITIASFPKAKQEIKDLLWNVLEAHITLADDNVYLDIKGLRKAVEEL